MSSRRRNGIARTVVAALLAVAVHLVVLVLFDWLGVFDAPAAGHRYARSQAHPTGAASARDDDRPMEISALVDELDRADEKSREEKSREEEAKKEESDLHPGGQVIDLAKPAVEERPDRANYVSEYDSKVDRETRGAHGREQAGAKAAATPPPPGRPDVSAPDPGALAPPTPASGGRPGRPGPLAMRELERRHAVQRATPGPAATADGELERAGQPAPDREPATTVPTSTPKSGEGGDGAQPGGGRQAATPGLPNGRPNLALTPDLAQRAIGQGAGSMDYLKDLDDGESTAVNSKRWNHAPFFNRIKRAVANEWHPEAVYMIHDASGHVYGFKDRVTVLRVHLSPDGKLVNSQVLTTSGVDFLDDEAVAAFRKAAPFHNPPKALVEADGQIHFNFAFIFELSGRGSVKVFKYQ